MIGPRTVLGLLKEAYFAWREHRAVSLGAALSYYAVFSMPSLLVIVIAVVSLAFGREAAEGRIVSEFRGLMGEQTAGILTSMLKAGAGKDENLLAGVIGVIVLIFGATGAFGELQAALNSIWGVRPKPEAGFRHMARTRLASFSMVLVIGFLLLISLIVSAFLTSFGEYLAGIWTEPVILKYVFYALDLSISTGVITVLFAMIFKVLPDAEVNWSDVWMGAFVTAVLFTAGKFLISLYIGRSDAASYYGAAGSLVLMLLWIYYSSLILYFGAEFTQVYANRYGSRIRPAEYAEPAEARRRKAA